MEENVLDDVILMSNDAASVNDGLLGLLDDRVGGGLGVRDDDGLLDVDRHDATEECQDGKDEGKESHGDACLGCDSGADR